jgi:peptidoglycan/xylan/chitin deacetylase (PgdA/CDA1 family)
MERVPLEVLITVDTEVWPHTRGWRESQLAEDFERDIVGRTSAGAFGLEYQLQALQAHGLKAVFFVEALAASVVGGEPLGRIVRTIQEYGQDVQLHAHIEWLNRLDAPPWPGVARAQNFSQFPAEGQAAILRRALENLRAAGAFNVTAFRAGNFGANLDTLAALNAVGIAVDSSYNSCLLRGDWPGVEPRLWKPARICGVQEFPVSFFQDGPGHFRHTQLKACSWREMRRALTAAWRSGWRYFVIVSHSFELVKRRSDGKAPAKANPIAIRRFERLLKFLERESSRFQTTTFPLAPVDTGAAGAILRGSWINTLGRYAEQALSRLMY